MIEMRRFRIGKDNLSYLFHDGSKALLVDPGHDPAEALEFIHDSGLSLVFVVLTHHHSDHSSSLAEVVERTGARSVSSDYCFSRIGTDVIVRDGDRLEVGSFSGKVLETPGHTPGGICLVIDGRYLVTGDTLFIDDCGRCDLAGGSLKDMFISLQRLKELEDDLLVLPGHDYGPVIEDSLGSQKVRSRVLLARNIEEFSGI